MAELLETDAQDTLVFSLFPQAFGFGEFI